VVVVTVVAVVVVVMVVVVVVAAHAVCFLSLHCPSVLHTTVMDVPKLDDRMYPASQSITRNAPSPTPWPA
jgi:hypothetical protein